MAAPSGVNLVWTPSGYGGRSSTVIVDELPPEIVATAILKGAKICVNRLAQRVEKMNGRTCTFILNFDIDQQIWRFVELVAKVQKWMLASGRQKPAIRPRQIGNAVVAESTGPRVV